MGSCKDYFRVALTMRATFAPPERKPRPSHKRGSPHQHRSHFMRENQGFRAISTLQTSAPRNVKAAIPMQNAILDHQTIWHSAWVLQRSPPRSADHGGHFCAIRAQTEREPHPSHKRGSPHQRREPLYARKHRVSCDFYPPSMPSTKRPSISHISTLSLHISALLYSLHISTLSTSLLSPYLCSLHISTLSTSLLFPHPYPLDISNLFTPLTRHLSTLFTPQISSHPYSLHSSNLFTSVLASLL